MVLSYHDISDICLNEGEDKVPKAYSSRTQAGCSLPSYVTELAGVHTAKYTMHGQCNDITREPRSPSPAARHHHHSAITKLYCLVTEANVCEKLAQSHYVKLNSRELNSCILTASPMSEQLYHHATFKQQLHLLAYLSALLQIRTQTTTRRFTAT